MNYVLDKLSVLPSVSRTGFITFFFCIGKNTSDVINMDHMNIIKVI